MTENQVESIVLTADNPVDAELQKVRRAEKAQKARETPEASQTPDPQSHAAEQLETSVTYYPINEAAAKCAKEASSFSDYKPGSATAEYRHYVDEAAGLAAKQKKRIDPSFHEKIDGLLDAYARKLAANMNKGYEITASVPSIMITGGSNFPIRKKEKQNAAADKNMQELTEIQGLLDKIRSVGTGGISADDPNAVTKLKEKLQQRQNLQSHMKNVNAYYRKNGTMKGFEGISDEKAAEIDEDVKNGYSWITAPYASFQLSNNNAEINRLKKRIESLERCEKTDFVGWEFDGGQAVANHDENRLQLIFDEKPGEEQRSKLKHWGFRWSPSNKAWQRQLNDNAIRAAGQIEFIKPLDGRTPCEMQKPIRQEAAVSKTETKTNTDINLLLNNAEQRTKMGVFNSKSVNLQNSI